MRLDQPVGVKLRVSVDDADPAYAELLREIARGRQAVTGGQTSAFDLQPKMPGKLLVNRLNRVLVEGNVKHVMHHSLILTRP